MLQSSKELVSLPPEYCLQLEAYLFKYRATLFSIRLVAVYYHMRQKITTTPFDFLIQFFNNYDATC